MLQEKCKKLQIQIDGKDQEYVEMKKEVYSYL